MKKSIIIILFACILLPCKVLAQSDSIVIWSEDFTGCYQWDKPANGKNATYTYGKANNQLRVMCTENSNGKSPELNISGGYTFTAAVALYGASGSFVLSFKGKETYNLKITSTDGVGIKKRDDNHYIVDAPVSLTVLTLNFKANYNSKKNSNVYLDDICLKGPIGCRTGNQPNKLSFSQDTLKVILGESFTPIVLNNPNNLKLNYWSSDKTVATVDSLGNAQPLTLGYATISAIFTGNDSLSYKETSYVLHVDRRVPEDEIFFEDFSNSLTIGGRDSNNNYSGGKVTSYDNSHSGGNPYKAYKCIGVENSSTFSAGSFSELQDANGILYFLAKSQNNSSSGCRVSISGGGTIASSSFTTTYGKWELISVPFKNATAKTVFTIAGNKVFIDSVSIRVLPKTVTLSVGSTGYASMYYGRYALKVPEGVRVFTMKAEDNNEKVVISHEYASASVIPEGTGVIIKAKEGDYVFDVVDKEGTSDEDNRLKGSDYQMLTTGGDIYYMLANDNGKAGLYWGAEQGGAFMSGAHKAYLALTNAAGAKSGYAFELDDETAGIDNSIVMDGASEGACFNVLGQRINGKVYKGIIIRKGKKFIKR